MQNYNVDDMYKALRMAHNAGNTEHAKRIAQMIAGAQQTQEQPTQQPEQIEQVQPTEQPEEKKGFLSKLGSGLKEAFTGEKRKTEATQKAKSLMDMPEIKDDVFSTFASLFADNEELEKMLKIRYPELKTRKDEKGNIIYISNDGAEYTNKPGASKSDIPRVIANVLSFLPSAKQPGLRGRMIGAAAKQPSLRGRMIGAAATQAGIESLQQQMGGDADLSEVALAAAAEPVGEVISAVPGIAKKGIGLAREGLEKLVPATKETIEDVATRGAAEFGATSRAAATSKFTKQNEIRKLAQELPLDEDTFIEAEKLGITEHLQPDHLTTNQAFKSYSQAIKSLPGSKAQQLEIEGKKKIVERGIQLIEELGGTEEYSTLSFDIKNRMKQAADALEEQSNKMYSDLKKSINPKTKVKTDNVISFINKRAGELNGFDNLTPTEKMIYRKLSPKKKTVKETIDNVVADYDQGEFVSEFGVPQPTQRAIQEVQEKTIDELPTYALLDDVRKELTQARVKKSGPFKNAESGLIKKLESQLLDDQRAVAESFGQLELFDTARKTVAIRKSLEDDIKSIFGRELDKSIVDPLTSAIKKLPDGNEDNFINFIKRIPEDQRQEVVASGLSVAMGRQSKSGKLSFKNFADFWERLRREPRAYNALMSNLPKENRDLLNSFAKVSRSIADTERFIGTGRLNAIEKAMDGAAGLTTKLLKTGGIAVSAMVSPRFASMMALAKSMAPGGNRGILQLADDLISSDDFIRAVRTLPDNEDKAVNIILNSAKFKKFQNFAKETDRFIKEDPDKWIRSAMQATRQQREDQQNDR